MPVRSHFNLFNKDTRDLFMLYIVFMWQLNNVLFIIVVCYFFRCLTFIHSFNRLLFSFDSLLFIHPLFIVQKGKDSILILDSIPGISILLYPLYKNTITIYASQETSYIRLHRLCLSIGVSGLL
jgi:hypothetical protein